MYARRYSSVSENALCVSVHRCLCVPSDQEYVEGYRVLVLSELLPSSDENSGICNSALGDTQTIQTDVAFDSKVGVLTALLVGGTGCWSVCIYLHHGLSFCASSVGQPEFDCSWNRGS